MGCVSGEWPDCRLGHGAKVLQTLSTTYASEVVPTVLRPYVTAWVCMCWGLGNVIASVVVRATSTMGTQWGELRLETFRSSLIF